MTFGLMNQADLKRRARPTKRPRECKSLAALHNLVIAALAPDSPTVFSTTPAEYNAARAHVNKIPASQRINGRRSESTRRAIAERHHVEPRQIQVVKSPYACYRTKSRAGRCCLEERRHVDRPGHRDEPGRSIGVNQPTAPGIPHSCGNRSARGGSNWKTNYRPARGRAALGKNSRTRPFGD